MMGVKPAAPWMIRVSSGSASVLGLRKGQLKANPTTAYLLTYLKGKCMANCGFCSQARDSRSRVDVLSRVTWPAFDTRAVLSKLAIAAQLGKVKRVCIQTLYHPESLEELMTVLGELKRTGMNIPVSVSCQPLTRERIERLQDAGVERIGVALDAATKEVFDRVKGYVVGGPYDWDTQRKILLEAVQVFGKGRVSTHLIVGLGETEKEMVDAIQWCVDGGICPALFAFTPVPGTALELRFSPAIDHYRRIQLARFLIVQGKTRVNAMRFNAGGDVAHFGVPSRILEDAIQSGVPFITSGCPNCNRPYYNERPGGPLFNYPAQPTPNEVKEIRRELGEVAGRSRCE